MYIEASSLKISNRPSFFFENLIIFQSFIQLRISTSQNELSFPGSLTWSSSPKRKINKFLIFEFLELTRMSTGLQ